MTTLHRWLSPEQCAARIGAKEHQLPRMVRAGKLPAPSLHLGPRTPRYDILALDALMSGAQSVRSADQATQETVSAIIERARRKTAAGGRNRAGISV